MWVEPPVILLHLLLGLFCNGFPPRNNILYRGLSVLNNHKWFPVPFFFCFISQQELKVQRLFIVFTSRTAAVEKVHLPPLTNMKSNKEQIVIKIKLEQNKSRPEKDRRDPSFIIRLPAWMLHLKYGNLFLVQEVTKTKVHDMNRYLQHWLCSPTVIPHGGMKINKSFWTPVSSRYVHLFTKLR